MLGPPPGQRRADPTRADRDACLRDRLLILELGAGSSDAAAWPLIGGTRTSPSPPRLSAGRTMSWHRVGRAASYSRLLTHAATVRTCAWRGNTFSHSTRWTSSSPSLQPSRSTSARSRGRLPDAASRAPRRLSQSRSARAPQCRRPRSTTSRSLPANPLTRAW
jgi:hypothetical protein